MMTQRIVMLSAALPLLAASALAEGPTRVRGTILSLDGTTLHVRSAVGQEVTVALAQDYKVTALLPAHLADIAPGSFIGTAADAQPDGTLVAREVHIFPEAMRGAGEGFRPFDLGPKSTMTNGTVGQEVKGMTGNTLTVAFKGGVKTILVPPAAPVVTFAPGDRAMLAPGQHVIVQAQAGAGGALMADRVTVGKDGLVPPM